MKTKIAVLIEPGRFELHEREISLKAGQVLVKVAACGLCNYELNHWKGLLGQFPQTVGHEWTGTVVELGPEVKELKIGDRITGLPEGKGLNAGFSEYMAASVGKCIRLDPKVDLKYAISEPLKCVITVIRAAGPEAGDHAVIQGCGPMGLWCIQALKGNLLSSLIALDVNEERLALAKKYGATHLVNSRKVNAEQQVAAITNGHMADFVIDGTGIPQLLNSAQRYLKNGRGRLVLMSSHEESCKDFDFREAVARSLQIIVAHPAYSADQIDDMRRAVSFLNSGIFSVKEFISHEFSLDDIQTAFETLEHKPSGYMKGIVIP